MRRMLERRLVSSGRRADFAAIDRFAGKLAGPFHTHSRERNYCGNSVNEVLSLTFR